MTSSATLRMNPFPSHFRGNARLFGTCRPAKFRTLGAVLLAFISVSCEAPAQPPPPSRYDVESVYIFDFAKFVRWPAEAAQGPVTICVAGPSVYTDTLTKIVSGEQIDHRPLAVRPIGYPADATDCRILFIADNAKSEIDSLLAATTGKPILTVSDTAGFIHRGGMVEFVTVDNRVRFSVDLAPVARGRIALSSQLLKVALNVTGKSPAGVAQ